ncbi:MAG: hypothetical protein EB121_05535 [Alphaproteobacteria bacterium]|nr:hypothetical protein [Alphaproteobacteria bacterium]
MPRVVVPPHPLIGHWLTLLRDHETPPALFSTALSELGRWLTYEALRDWIPYQRVQVQTPLAHAVSEEARIGSKGKTDDAGNRIMGQGVQIWQGAKLVAEVYDPESLKESFGKAPAAKVIEKKKK